MASATYSAEHVNQLLRCPVCLDRYNSPKILPCQHTVCKSPCLEGLIDRFSRTVKCPECRAEHFVPRNGVDSFPTNITISGFLDLQATASGESRQVQHRDDASGAASGESPRRCGVCENETETIKCFHCDKMVCHSCKQSHTGQMKMVVVRLINQIRRGLPKLSNRLSEVERKGEEAKQAVEAVKAHVRGTIDRFINDLKERELSLCSELDTFQQGELRSLRLHSENIEVELASISSYCDSMEGFLNSADANIPEADLVNVKHQCSQYMQQLRQAENEEIPQLRSVRFDFSGDSLRGSITRLGTVTVLTPNTQGRSTRNDTVAENTQNQRSRARWTDSSPRVPLANGFAVQNGGATPQNAVATYSRPSYSSPSPPARYHPTPPYQTDPMLSSRSPRNDSSWIQPSYPVGEPPRSIYLPSRHEDYMFSMSTNTDDVREVLGEMRRQEQWEMNNTIREQARNRNNQQNISLFGQAQRGGGRGRRPVERMAGLMGGGDDESNHTQQPVADSSHTAAGSTSRGAGRSSRVGIEARGVQQAANATDADSLQALEDEIHHMDVQGSPPVQTNPARNRNGLRRTLQPRANPNVTSADDRPLMGGGQPVNDNQNSSNDRPPPQRGSDRISERGRGRGGVRPAPNRTSNVTRNQRPDNAQLTPTPSTSNLNNSISRGNGANNGPRRTNQNGSNAPAPATRSRTFVQQESNVSGSADLPTVTNNGMSFSINLDDTTAVLGAVGDGNTSNTTTNRNNAVPRPNDSLQVSQAINKYKRKSQPIKTVGNGRGNREGNFTWPRGVAFSPLNNNIIVADSSNHRVQIFDFNGAFVKTFGSYGQNETEFDCLAGVAVSPLGEIIICDRYNHRVQVFDRDGQFKRTFGSEGNSDGQLSYPWGVTSDAAGFIYVCDKENHRIQVFNNNGAFVRKFGTLGNRPGQLENPHYIAITPENKVLVSDSSNHRIQMFSTNGTYIKSFGVQGNGQGQMKYPKGLVVDAQGFIIVADSGNSRVQVYRGNGDYFCHFGSAGTGNGQFRGLEGIALTTDGKIVVCDKDNHRIQIF